MWTTTVPSEPGWYWWRADAGDTPVILRLYSPRQVDTPIGRARAVLLKGEWSGPLQPPDGNSGQGKDAAPG